MTTTIEFRGKGGPDGGAFRYVSAADVLMGAVPTDVLHGAIVLVGTTAAGLNDIRATPVNAEFPGVEVHANLIKSILDGHFKSRPDYALAIEFGQVVLVGLLLGGALAVATPAAAVLLAGGALAGALGLNWWLYQRFDAALDVAVLLLLIAALFVANLAWGYFFEVRKGRALVSRFGQYVAPELVAQMADNPDRYSMDGESRELTVLFADVRGFTAISEQMTPQELREYINLYLTAMSEDIRDSHGGTLDKYIGDAVMAFWGAPVAFPDHASRAVASALLMQQSAASFEPAIPGARLAAAADRHRHQQWPDACGRHGLAHSPRVYRDGRRRQPGRAPGRHYQGVWRGHRRERIHARAGAAIRLPRTGPRAGQGQDRTGGHLRAARLAQPRPMRTNWRCWRAGRACWNCCVRATGMAPRQSCWNCQTMGLRRLYAARLRQYRDTPPGAGLGWRDQLRDKISIASIEISDWKSESV